MELLVGDKGKIDFDAPVKMNIDQRKKFINFLKSIFSVVEIIESERVRTERLGDILFLKNWSVDEYAVLLEVEDTNNVAEMLGRSWMSVDIKRGEFLPTYLAWAKEKKIDIVKGDTKKLIKEFMKEHEDELRRRSEERKLIHEIEKIPDRLKEIESDTFLLNTRNDQGNIDPGEYVEKLEKLDNEKKDLLKMLKTNQLICSKCGTSIDNTNGGSGYGNKCVCHKCAPIKIKLVNITSKNNKSKNKKMDH
jgi:dsDNA-binding SOS-regulon protein